MAALANWIRTRIVPAVLTALGVAFLASGLLSYASPVAADPLVTPSPDAGVALEPTPSPRITLPPLASGTTPSASPSRSVDRIASRIRIAALKIDLPVIRGVGYPVCNVALYFASSRIGQPGEGRATYIYAHARKGMFLPMLTASKVADGKKMIGMIVEVWTNDDQRFLYVISEVRRHVPASDALLEPFAARTEQLWLQTSEGVGPQPKLQLVAEPLSQETADHAEAHPKPRPVDCE
jgi:hypothetical protein